MTNLCFHLLLLSSICFALNIDQGQAKIDQVKRTVPGMLYEEGLYVNKSKNEKHHVNKYSNKSWRSCNYLGSLVGTEEDIKQESFSSWKLSHLFKSILKSELMSESVRIRVFKAYFESIFVCNSELQTLTKALESFINSFQFRLLRKLIHVVWPKIITNVDLYECTKATPWSITICQRRLLWFGHLLCLPSETLASQSRKAFTKTW